VSKFVVFDFDGVLCHTAPECLELAFRAAVDRADHWTFASRWEGLSSVPSDVAALFLKHRYWVAPPWQYALLLKMIAENDLPSSTEEFIRIAQVHREHFEHFTHDYFAMRKQVMKDHRKWLSLMEPVAAAAECFREQVAAGRGLVLSTRDHLSIQVICQEILGVKLGSEHFLPRAGTLEKHELLAQMAQVRDISPADIFFIDDYLDHALPAYKQGFRAHLATWGYLGPEDLDRAARMGLPKLELGELKASIASHLAS